MSAVIGADVAGSAAVPSGRLPATKLEAAFVDLLAGVLRIEPDRVSVDSHFFEELGADSLVMAHFCARVRKHGELPSVSMRDIYAHPSIASLAASLATAAAAAAPTRRSAATEATRTSAAEHALCGALQFAFFLAYTWVGLAAIGAAFAWISAGPSPLDIYLRLVAFSVGGFAAVAALPILAKWTLIGRWQHSRIRLWSLAYVRFWIVRTLIRTNPIPLLFAGTPLYNLYLRALGARIGAGVVIFGAPPTCTDLLSIGSGTVIRRESLLPCYRAHAGRIETGSVTLGSNVVVGERTVLDIDTSMGDGSQLGHNSALHRGQSVPAGERWHGSPALRTKVDYLRVGPARCGAARRATYCIVVLLLWFLIYLPLAEGSLFLVAALAPSLANLVNPGAAGAGAASPAALLGDAFALSALSVFGTVFAGLLLVMTVPRLLNLLLKPDTVYPLFGIHDWAHRTIHRLTNSKFLLRLFGDSSFSVHYLSCLGYKLKPVLQSGSNFGIDVKHSNPYLCSIGTGTMVADGLSMVNEELSSTSFRVTQVTIGKDNFIGNNIAYPAGARTGDNCLLATKVSVPLDGEMREGVGLLGSPCFEIPRTVERDLRFGDFRRDENVRRGLVAKNAYNLRTIGLFFFSAWFGMSLITVLNLAAFEVYDLYWHALTAALVAISVVVGGLYIPLVERCVLGFRRLEPTSVSIYEPYFWLHERVWKLPNDEYHRLFDGTPLKPVIWRLMGVRMGKRVFDDGGHISERTLTTVGDECVLNAGSAIQCHSQEDAAFKSDRTVLGDRCTVGVGAMVHYGVKMGDGAVLAADSFLMKGEEMPAGARWGGNPAREMEVT